jgi:hypothetical protein
VPGQQTLGVKIDFLIARSRNEAEHSINPLDSSNTELPDEVLAIPIPKYVIDHDQNRVYRIAATPISREDLIDIMGEEWVQSQLGGGHRMGTLSREQKRTMRTVLKQVILFRSSDGRNALLRDLPPKLVSSISRSNDIATDLSNIIEAVDVWGQTETLTMLENILEEIDGSASAEPIRDILDSLSSRVDS